MIIPEHDRPYLLSLRPSTDRLVFCTPGRCGPGIMDGPGCGMITRPVYMSQRPRLLAAAKGRVRWAMCPVCGRRYTFAFWKLHTDDRYVPTSDEQDDLRSLYHDFKRMASHQSAGCEPQYGLTFLQACLVHGLPHTDAELGVRLLYGFGLR